MKAPTSNQPQVDATLRIYGSRKVIPLDSANQPEVIPTKTYGSKVLPTVKVRLKNSDDDLEIIVNERDFDDEKYLRVD